jgi:hypothetical protein
MFTTTLCPICTAIVTVPAATGLTTRHCRCRGCGSVVSAVGAGTHEPWDPGPTAQVIPFPTGARLGQAA